LDAHPDVCGPAPLHILRVVAMEFHKYGDLKKKGAWHQFIEDLLALTNSKFAKWNKNFTRGELENMAEIGDIPKLCRGIYEAEAAAAGKEILFVKELWTHRYISFLQWCFPEAKYVYLVRDPRDMALSWRKSPTHSGGVVAGARQWINDQSQTVSNFSALEQGGKALLVRYEDLVSNSEKELNRVCDLLGLEYSPSMLDFHKNDLTKANADKNPLWKNLATKVIADNFHKYRTELTAHEITVIECICNGTMQYFGYMPENNAKAIRAITSKKVNALHWEEMKTYMAMPQQRVHDKIQSRLHKSVTVHGTFSGGTVSHVPSNEVGANEPKSGNGLSLGVQFQNTSQLLQQRVKDVLKNPPLDLNQVKFRYAIISTPRCGSSMFCDILKRTEKLGRPEEWLNLRRIRAYCQVKGLKNVSFSKYVDEITRYTTSSTGIFGVNFHVDQYRSLLRRNIDILDAMKFDKIYYLRREDKVSQAYSLAKARVSDVWSSNVALTPAAQKKVDGLSNSDVLAELARIGRWEEVAAGELAEKIDATFEYDNVLADETASCFRQIFSDAGIAFPSDFQPIAARTKQSGEQDLRKIEAIKQYLAERHIV
jgi:LPS sulfotransferase NodH